MATHHKMSISAPPVSSVPRRSLDGSDDETVSVGAPASVESSMMPLRSDSIDGERFNGVEINLKLELEPLSEALPRLSPFTRIQVAHKIAQDLFALHNSNLVYQRLNLETIFLDDKDNASLDRTNASQEIGEASNQDTGVAVTAAIDINAFGLLLASFVPYCHSMESAKRLLDEYPVAMNNARDQPKKLYWESVLDLAKACTSQDEKIRPTMGVVSEELGGLADHFKKFIPRKLPDNTQTVSELLVNDEKNLSRQRRLNLMLNAATTLNQLHENGFVRNRVAAKYLLVYDEHQVAFGEDFSPGADHPWVASTLPTKESNVYQFGLVMLDMLLTRDEHQKFLKAMPTNNEFPKAFFTSYFDDLKRKFLNYPRLDALMDLISSCLQEDQHKRPSMQSILESLQKVIQALSLAKLTEDCKAEVKSYIDKRTQQKASGCCACLWSPARDKKMQVSNKLTRMLDGKEAVVLTDAEKKLAFDETKPLGKSLAPFVRLGLFPDVKAADPVLPSPQGGDHKPVSLPVSVKGPNS